MFIRDSNPIKPMFNVINSLRYFQRLALKRTLPRGCKRIIRERGYLDRWQAARLLRCAPHALAGSVFVFNFSAKDRWRLTLLKSETYIAGPRGTLP